MLTKLTAAQLAARPDYVQFFQRLAVGEGGMASVAEEGVGRQSLKGRLAAAASAAGVQLKFNRSGEGTVVFEVVSREAEPVSAAPYTGKRRGRPPRSA